MPVYFLEQQGTKLDVIVEAKSETAARLHFTQHIKAEAIGAKRIAELVMRGVKVERAGKEAEAAEAAERA